MSETPKKPLVIRQFTDLEMAVFYEKKSRQLETRLSEIKRAFEIQSGVFENTVIENTQLQTELTEAKRRIDELERKEYQLKKDNIESLDLLAADTALQNRLADQIESKDKQLIEARAEIERKDKLIEQMKNCYNCKFELSIAKECETCNTADCDDSYLYETSNWQPKKPEAAEGGES